MEYIDFIKSKMAISAFFGFDIHQSEINPLLKPHQKDTVQWSIKGGCRAIFASYGLGKTFCQLEILRIIGRKEGGKQLVIAPLGVRQEFKADAEKLDINIQFVRWTEEVQADGLYITNYESVRDGRLDINLFNAVSLDEASVLRSYGSLTFQTFLSIFGAIKYKFVATATPSPNRYKEIIHYSGFLGVMDSGQALTRFFKRDSTQANNLTLMPHMEKEFWLWVSSWALFLQYPSDLGYDNTGYDLPDLNIHYHEVKAGDVDRFDRRDGQRLMFGDSTLSLADAATEKRGSIENRVSEMLDIVKGYGQDQLIVWCDLDAEQKAIEKALKSIGVSYVSLYGGTNIDDREKLILQWKNKEKQIFVSKPMMYGSGINMQQCHIEIFLGINFKANDFLQAIHRVYRFLQDQACQIHLIYATSELGILQVLKKKWANHDKMVGKMTDIIKKYGLSHGEMMKELERSIGIKRIEVRGKNFIAANNDCVHEAKLIESDSVGLIHTSIPFANHYEYTPCYDQTTEILTRSGWKLFCELSDDDIVATVTQDTKMLEWHKPNRIIWQKYKGKMYRFHSRGVFDLLVTPDHKMFTAKKTGRKKPGQKNNHFELITAESLNEKYSDRKYRMISAAMGKNDHSMKKFINIPELPNGKRGPVAKKIDPIYIDDFMELAGWYLSEGCCEFKTDGYSKHSGRISISQQHEINPMNVEKIKSLFQKMGINPRYEGRSIVVHNRALSKYLIETFGQGSYFKKIPRWVKDLPCENLKILRDTMMLGDGNANGMAYTTFSKKLQDDFQEICFMTGWRTHLSEKFNTIRIGQKRTQPDIRRKPEPIEYDGMVGCVEVKNHTVVVRRNGSVVISGNSYNDFGFTKDNAHFWDQMDFLTPELYRMLSPGRIAAIHIKDRIMFGNVTGLGFPTCDNMLEETSLHFQKYGFKKIGIITIVTDVVRENNQTYRLGWTEQCKDGSKMGVGCPEYILLFRKPQTDKTKGFADVPVVKSKEDYTRAKWQIDAHAFWRSSGNVLLDTEFVQGIPTKELLSLFKKYQQEEIYNYDHHVKIGEDVDMVGKLPSTFMSIAPESHHYQVWTDINRMITLNSKQAKRNVALHLCPLQIDTVTRIITRYSNEGDLVYDPFGGIGTVPIIALRLGRKGRCSELNHGYFLDSVKYLESEEKNVKTPSLFDYFEERITA